jgi:hypothetical protein
MEIALNREGPTEIVVETIGSQFDECIQIIEEGFTKNVDGIAVRKDSPHFEGDDVHVHIELPGGYELSWMRNGRRRHPRKFPANIPDKTKAAAARVLGVSPTILEWFEVDDDALGRRVVLVEINAVKQLARTIVEATEK